MSRVNPIWIVLPLLIMLSGCFKKDEQVSPHPRGDEKSDTIPMTQRYVNQVYFDLDSLGIVNINFKTPSDLAVDCSPEGWIVLLNSANFMYAADLGITPFGIPQDTVGVTWRFDKSDGNPDSTAIGRWFDVTPDGDTVSNQHVYAINRGVDTVGFPLGYAQVIFDSLKHGTYYFRFAPLEGGNVVSAVIPKDASVNFLYFSFNNGGMIRPLQPPREHWDLLFTQYTTLLFTDLGEAYPYLVTGVLTSRNGVEVARDSTHAFSEITFDLAQHMAYSSSLDAIGYDWKEYNFEAAVYTVKVNLTYLIKNRNGYYYKLRFVGFYNDDGQKGYPGIEYQRL